MRRVRFDLLVNREARYLYRILRPARTEEELAGDAPRTCVRSGCSLGHDGRHKTPEGSRMGTAVELQTSPVFVVPDIEGLTWGVADRIIRPGGELVLAAVARPGVATAFGRGLEAEGRIRDDVDPGRGVVGQARVTVTYSLPSAANPPSPLKNSSSGVRSAASRSGRIGGISLSGRRGSTQVPRRDRVDRTGFRAAPTSTTRAAETSRARVSAIDQVRPKDEYPAWPMIRFRELRPRLAGAHQRLDRRSEGPAHTTICARSE